MSAKLITWTDQTVSFGYFASQVEAGRIDLDPAHQRGVVHDTDWQSQVLHSGIIEGDIPEVYFHERGRGQNGGDKIWESLDGKQRSSAIVGYLRDEYPYSASEPEEMTGRKFSDLSDSLQNMLKESCTLRIRIAKQTLTDAQIERFFQKRQNTKRTTPGEHLNSCITSPLLKPLRALLQEEGVAAHMATISRVNKREGHLEMLTRIARCYGEEEKVDCSAPALVGWFTSDGVDADLEMMQQLIRKTLDVLAGASIAHKSSKAIYLAVAHYLVTDCAEDDQVEGMESIFVQNEVEQLVATLAQDDVDLTAENGEKSATDRAIVNLRQAVEDYRE